MRKLSLIVAMMVMVSGTACATLGRQAFKEPVVTLDNVSINGLGFNGGSLDVVLNVYNPNHFRLDATRITYKLFVDSVALGTGTTDSRFTVDDGDSTQVRLPLTFTWAGIGSAGRGLMSTGTVNYRVVGDITVGSSVGNFTLPYDRTGMFSALGGTKK